MEEDLELHDMYINFYKSELKKIEGGELTKGKF
jgi:hypothetical protein